MEIDAASALIITHNGQGDFVARKSGNISWTRTSDSVRQQPAQFVAKWLSFYIEMIEMRWNI